MSNFSHSLTGNKQFFEVCLKRSKEFTTFHNLKFFCVRKNWRIIHLVSICPLDVHTYVGISGSNKCYFFEKFCVCTKTQFHNILGLIPAGIFLFKLKSVSTRTMCETPERRRQWPHSSFLLVSFEQISHIVLVFPLLPRAIRHTAVRCTSHIFGMLFKLIL